VARKRNLKMAPFDANLLAGLNRNGHNKMELVPLRLILKLKTPLCYCYEGKIKKTKLWAFYKSQRKESCLYGA